MKKVLIALYIPAIQEYFDVFLPETLEIGILTALLAKGTSEICRGRYIYSGQELLVQKDPDLLLNPDKTLTDYNIKDGTQLVLI